MQTQITFPIHNRENNPESQAHIDANRPHFSDQCRKVYEWLSSGKTLTCKEAMNLLDVMDLRARIRDLRNAGINIPDKKAGNGKCKYKVYYIEHERR